MRQQLESQRIESDILRTRLDKLTRIWLLFEIYKKKNNERMKVFKQWRLRFANQANHIDDERYS